MGWLGPYPELHTVAAQMFFHCLLLVMPDLLVVVTAYAVCTHVQPTCSITFWKSSWDASVAHKHLKEGAKRTEWGSFQWVAVTAQETMKQVVPPGHQEVILYSMSDGALAQVAQRCCEVSSLEIFKRCLAVVLGTLLRVALLEQGLDQRDPEVPANLHNSDIVWYLIYGNSMLT